MCIAVYKREKKFAIKSHLVLWHVWDIKKNYFVCQRKLPLPPHQPQIPHNMRFSVKAMGQTAPDRSDDNHIHNMTTAKRRWSGRKNCKRCVTGSACPLSSSSSSSSSSLSHLYNIKMYNFSFVGTFKWFPSFTCKCQHSQYPEPLSPEQFGVVLRTVYVVVAYLLPCQKL